MQQSETQRVVLGTPQSRVSQAMAAGESFPSNTLYQEVSVSPASALCACEEFMVRAAQSLQLGSVQWKAAPALSRGMGPAFNSSMVPREKQQSS